MVKESSSSSWNLGSLWSFFAGPSRIYIVEHFLMLIALALVVISAIGLFNAGFDYFVGESSTEEVYPIAYMDSVSYPAPLPNLNVSDVIGNVALALVALPMFSLLYVRTRKAERMHSELMNNRARRRIEYVWLAIAVVLVIVSSVTLVQGWLEAAMGTETGQAATEAWWQTTLKLFFTIGFIKLAILLVARVTPSLPVKGGDHASK